uniref:Uncharacterized protein n=1 Tax=Rhodnius prolixus TaxID=13249 RepID=T1IBS7_RHOPR
MDESKLIELLTKFKDEIKQDVNLKFKEMSNLLEEKFTQLKKSVEVHENKISFLEREWRRQDIYISEDFSYETRAKRKELFGPMVEARKAGKIAYIRYDKLIIKEPSDKFIGSKRMLESSPKFQEVNKKENKRHKTEVKQLARSFSTRDISHFFRDGSDSDGSTSQSSKGNRGRKRED